MNNLTLNDVIVFLGFLLGPRRPALEAIPQARAYATTLDQTLAELRALPPETFGGAANAEPLAETDARHDGFGLALHYLALSYQSCPTASAEAKDAAKCILEGYVPSKGHLRTSYATEAARAEARQAQLSADEATLDRLPVEGGTAHDWASAYVSAGVALGSLLAGRADATGTRTSATSDRVQAIADIRALRDLIARALRRTPDGGRAVDDSLFNFLDLLADLRDRGSKEPTPPPPVVAPTPA